MPKPFIISMVLFLMLICFSNIYNYHTGVGIAIELYDRVYEILNLIVKYAEKWTPYL